MNFVLLFPVTKNPEPSKAKCHWDFVIEEANWLFSVVQVEIKTKKAKIT